MCNVDLRDSHEKKIENVASDSLLVGLRRKLRSEGRNVLADVAILSISVWPVQTTEVWEPAGNS